MSNPNINTRHIFHLLTLSLSLHILLSQPQQLTTPNSCNGIFLYYNYTGGYPIPPTNPTNQPYRFESTLTILNNGPTGLPSWKAYVGFQNGEILVSSSNAALADGTTLPAFVGNGTVLVGFGGQSDLKSAVETAGDLSQMQVAVRLVGSRFLKGGSGGGGPPLPASLSLVNDGYSCPAPTFNGSQVSLCCNQNSTSQSNVTLGEFQSLQEGDLTIMYDIISTYDTDYWAQVTISNHNPLARLENWKLSWEWMRGEFVYEMKGAYPAVVDVRDCIFGSQGNYYQKMDFSQALNCEKTPTFVDLPPTLAKDMVRGNVPFCCRNGTILPPEMDSSRSISAFQMHVYKMPPDLNRTALNPPENWRINGSFGSDFQCGRPVQVIPSEFPDPTGLANRSAVASWQVVCNVTRFQEKQPKCCVTFSAFYNVSVIPCRTCACGCSQNDNPSQTCSATEPALLLPSQALLMPFDNRTNLATKWAQKQKLSTPNPLPCGDNCGVSIDWHLQTDYSSGWTAKITILNWEETDIADWFTSVELDKVGPGFEKVNSFNGSFLHGSNTTIFMQGFPGLNYIPAERVGNNPKKDPPTPGAQQSVILFSKKNTPGINVAAGDGYPTKVIFNGEECALPYVLPSSGCKLSATIVVYSLVMAVVLLWML